MIDDKMPWWVVAGFIFCALIGLAMMTGLGFLIYAGIQYLNRH